MQFANPLLASLPDSQMASRADIIASRIPDRSGSLLKQYHRSSLTKTSNPTMEGGMQKPLAMDSIARSLAHSFKALIVNGKQFAGHRSNISGGALYIPLIQRSSKWA